jgi:uncharacterized membrane-anchored protein
MARRKGETQREAFITGITWVDTSTKRLLQTISPGMAAVVQHYDIDELAAVGLIKAKVKLIVNAGQTMSGKVPVIGPLLLLNKGIPIVEIDPDWLPFIRSSMELLLTEASIIVGGHTIPYTVFTRERWLQRYHAAQASQQEQLSDFIDNTLSFAQREKALVLQPLRCEGMQTDLKDRPVLIVVRGQHYTRDLQALDSFIRIRRPVLIGVDGGADALIEQGFKPDLIVGDMDSVSDAALQCGAELIVQAYADGFAPGMRRIDHLGLQAYTLPACGISEDMALLLAYDHQCEYMITVGVHSHMADFLEKGRQGMGSSLLVRMKVGSKLIDAKGFHSLIDVRGESIPIWGRVMRGVRAWMQ